MSKKKIFIGSNLKMYKTVSETVSYLSELQQITHDLDRKDLTLFIIPSYTSLYSTKNIVDRELISIGSQNVCWEEKGQFTGEISPIMLQECDVNVVMVGHSERRHVFGEDDYTINKKILTILSHDMTALLCIGETENQKQFGISKEILREQLLIGLHDVDSRYMNNIWIAYEPVWAIGTNGIPATPEYINEMHTYIRECLFEIFGNMSPNIPILFGGSVNKTNAVDYYNIPTVDGLFVGRAAWNATDFNELIRLVLSDSKPNSESIVQ